MCPIYDFKCPKCGDSAGELMNFEQYEAFESKDCDKCGSSINKDNREMQGVTTRIVGVSKGNYNGRDYS